MRDLAEQTEDVSAVVNEELSKRFAKEVAARERMESGIRLSMAQMEERCVYVFIRPYDLFLRPYRNT